MGGGLNLVSPRSTLPNGTAIDAQNFECQITGGYRRIDGYERFDGHPRPSDAIYYTLTVTITGAIATGNTITGHTSTATGVVIAPPVLIAGSTYIVPFTMLTGTFTPTGEQIWVGGSSQGTTSLGQVLSGALDRATDAAWLNAAAAQYRANIAAVPGAGSILGVWLYNGVVYAFRNNAGNTAAIMWKSTSAGWVQVSLGYEQVFTGGSNGGATPAEGATLTGATSGHSGVISRVATTAGSWNAGSPSTGSFIFVAAVSGGGFTAGENLQISGVTVAVASGTTLTTSLAPSGSYEFITDNFYGGSSTIRMYGVSGVHRAFEFDGTVFVPITSGMSPDTPSHLAEHKYRLFLAFQANIQYSNAGTPYAYSIVTGSGEFGAADVVTGLKTQIGQYNTATLLVATRHKIYLLYGSSNADFIFVTYAPDLGAVPHTVQTMPQAIFMDDRGVVQLQTTQAYGSFASATVTQVVQPYIDARRGQVTASEIMRSRNQYRVYFSDGSSLRVSFNGNQLLGIMPVNYGKVVRCICSEEDQNGLERHFFGSDDGYVYESERGTSFDGNSFTAWVEPCFNRMGSPYYRKRYRRIFCELSSEIVQIPGLPASGSVEFSYAAGTFTTHIQYDDPDVPTDPPVAVTLAPGSQNWDGGSTWDQSSWDTRTISAIRIPITGTGYNITQRLDCNSAIVGAFTWQSTITHYTPRRISR